MLILNSKTTQWRSPIGVSLCISRFGCRLYLLAYYEIPTVTIATAENNCNLCVMSVAFLSDEVHKSIHQRTIGWHDSVWKMSPMVNPGGREGSRRVPVYSIVFRRLFTIRVAYDHVSL